MEHQKPVIPDPPAKRGKTSSERSRSMAAGDLESEEEKIRNFIEKLRNVDTFYYMFQRDNYLKVPCPCLEVVSPFIELIAKCDKMSNPIDGIDLGNVKHFSHDRMVEITGDFSEENYVRRSIFGRLFRGKIDQGSGMPPREVIVKRWDFSFPAVATHNSYIIYFTRQIEFLLNPHVASHPKMAKLIGYCCDKIFAVVFDLKLNLTLHDLIPRADFTWRPRVRVAKQVADTLKFFHGNQIALCQFTSPSISIDEQDYNIQLFEFDRSANLAPDNFPVVKEILGGIYNYYSPESVTPFVDFRREWFFTSDVYAFGLLLLELTLARCVKSVTEETPEDFVEWAKLASAKGDRFSPFNVTLYKPQMMTLDLAMKCVQEDPEMRPNMDEILVELDKLSQFETVG